MIIHYIRSLQEGELTSWGYSYMFIAPYWYLWALLTPLVLLLGRRFPVEGRRVWSSVLAHVPIAVVIALAHLFVTIVLIREIQREPPANTLLDSYHYMLAAYFEFDFMLYWAILGAGHLIDYHARYRAGALRAVQLEAQLAQARLQALKVQLQPHFLFNTLHAISSLMDDDVDQARRMLVRLGDLLRLTLETEGAQEVTLRQELECMELYLDIERVRFPDLLDVELLVEPDTLEAMVPNLIFQPLVENAVRYGIAPRENGGRIRITARREADMLRLQVLDDGAGTRPAASTEGHTGVGLANVRTRLSQLYGHRQEFQAFRPAGGGFAVELLLPFRSTSFPAQIPATV